MSPIGHQKEDAMKALTVEVSKFPFPKLTVDGEVLSPAIETDGDTVIARWGVYSVGCAPLDTWTAEATARMMVQTACERLAISGKSVEHVFKINDEYCVDLPAVLACA